MPIALRTAVAIFGIVFATSVSAQNVDWKVFVEPFVSAAYAQGVD